MNCPRPRRGSRPAALATALVAAALLAAPVAAHADTTAPGSYHAKATATALDLKVFGQGITLGLTRAENASTPESAASGIGALVPSLGNQVEQQAAATADNPVDERAQTCGPITLPADFPAVSLATACSAANAVVKDGFPASIGDASVLTVDVNGNSVLGSASSAVNAPIGQLLDGLQPVFAGLDQASGIDANSLLNQIVEAITKDGDLVRVALGPSHSTSSANQTVETATAAAQGAIVELLPRDLLGLPPVATIEVGAAANTITIDRNTGEATVEYDPSIVTVTLADDIAAALPSQVPNPISVTPGQSFCLGLPAPLDSCITVAGGTQGKNADGLTFAEASAVSLRLLTGVQDGVQLDLAATRVEGVGTLDTSRAAPPAPPAPDQPALARTGGTIDTLLAGSLFAAAIGGMAIARRARRRVEFLG
ncbi:MAG: hypothetical protein QOC92_4178 [Acidimicrobiaceae bacterium]